jgi:hypothetical protein
MKTKIEWINVKDQPVPILEEMPAGISIIVKLSKPSCNLFVHGAFYHPNVQTIGHQFSFDPDGEVTHWAWVVYPEE